MKKHLIPLDLDEAGNRAIEKATRRILKERREKSKKVKVASHDA